MSGMSGMSAMVSSGGVVGAVTIAQGATTNGTDYSWPLMVQASGSLITAAGEGEYDSCSQQDGGVETCTLNMLQPVAPYTRSLTFDSDLANSTTCDGAAELDFTINGYEATMELMLTYKSGLCFPVITSMEQLGNLVIAGSDTTIVQENQGTYPATELSVCSQDYFALYNECGGVPALDAKYILNSGFVFGTLEVENGLKDYNVTTTFVQNGFAASSLTPDPTLNDMMAGDIVQFNTTNMINSCKGQDTMTVTVPDLGDVARIAFEWTGLITVDDVLVPNTCGMKYVSANPARDFVMVWSTQSTTAAPQMTPDRKLSVCTRQIRLAQALTSPTLKLRFSEPARKGANLCQCRASFHCQQCVEDFGF
eukprot:Clim_evm34s66 gene=Clim_evmTU34s66